MMPSVDEAPGAGWTLSECRLGECGHPPAVCPQNQTLLVGRDVLLVLDFSFDLLSGVTVLNLDGEGLASQGLHKDLPLCTCWGGLASFSITPKCLRPHLLPLLQPIISALPPP